MQVACCSEEFLLALGDAAQPGVRGGSLEAPACQLWAGHGRQLLSTEPLTGQVLLTPQHACTGHERFTLQLSSAGEVRLLAEMAIAAGGSCSSVGSKETVTCGASAGLASRDRLCGASSSALVPVVAQQGMLLAPASEDRGVGASAAAKPAAFALELASAKPSLLLTAHGHLVSCPPAAAGGSARPAGVLPRAQRAAGAAGAAAPGGGAPPGPSPAAVERCAWVVHHHGGSVYSLRHAPTGQALYICEDGAPCLDPPGGRIVHPDERLLFWVEPGWVTLPADGGGGGRGGAAELGNAPQSEVSGFVQPSPSSHRCGSSSAGPGCQGSRATSGCHGGCLTAAGFSLRSVRRVGGRHVRLCALPDGLLTTVHATGPPSRWELFQVADLQVGAEQTSRLFQQSC